MGTSMHLFSAPFVFFLLAFCCTALGQNEDKFRQLVRLAQKSPIIHFNNADSYHKLVSEAGRNYTFFVHFTATAASYKCVPCGALAEEFRQFGESYAAYFGDFSNNAEFLEHPFFLAQVEPDDCMDVFQEYQFTTVPHMVQIPAGNKKVTKLRDNQFLRNPQANINDIISFVQKNAGVEIPIYQSLIEKVTPLLVLISAIVIMVKLVQKYQRSLYSPMLWYTLAVATYMIVMAGVVYNRIRNPPFMDVQNGRAQLIAPSPRTQYVAEGMIVAVVLGGAGVLLVVLGDYVPRLSNGWKRTAFWISAVLLFMFLSTLNSIIVLHFVSRIGLDTIDIYRMKYGSPAFRLNWRFF